MDRSIPLPTVPWPAPRPPASARRVDEPDSDERLARLVGEGDEAAFAAIDARYRPLLERYARSVVRDPHDAQDVVQCTLLAALRALRDGRRHAPLRPWLLRIAHNEAVSVLRRRREDVGLDRCAVGVQSAADAAEARADLRGMLDDMRQLSDRQRSALVMRELSGLGYAEIAQALDTSPVASRQLVCAARAALRRQALRRRAAAIAAPWSCLASRVLVTGTAGVDGALSSTAGGLARAGTAAAVFAAALALSGRADDARRHVTATPGARAARAAVPEPTVTSAHRARRAAPAPVAAAAVRVRAVRGGGAPASRPSTAATTSPSRHQGRATASTPASRAGRTRVRDGGARDSTRTPDGGSSRHRTIDGTRTPDTKAAVPPAHRAARADATAAVVAAPERGAHGTGDDTGRRAPVRMAG